MQIVELMGEALQFLRRKVMVGERKLAIVERLALTPQHTLCLVRVGEETLLYEAVRGAGTLACRVYTPVDTTEPRVHTSVDTARRSACATGGN